MEVVPVERRLLVQNKGIGRCYMLVDDITGIVMKNPDGQYFQAEPMKDRHIIEDPKKKE